MFKSMLVSFLLLLPLTNIYGAPPHGHKPPPHDKRPPNNRREPPRREHLRIHFHNHPHVLLVHHLDRVFTANRGWVYCHEIVVGDYVLVNYQGEWIYLCVYYIGGY